MVTAAPARARGGVSPRPQAPALRGAGSVAEPAIAAPAAAAVPDFLWHGGPVITCPQVYTSFWGSQWLSDPAHITRAGRLSQFLADLLKSGFMNVLNQYGVGFGAGVAGAFVRASFVTNVPTTLTNGGIEGIIQSCINAGALPEPGNPSNVALVIFLDESIGVQDPGFGIVMCEPTSDDAFGYHSFFTTAAHNPCYYAVIPGLSDDCLKKSCASDAGCSLHLSETQEQRQTQVASHEFAEMTTDPQLNAWYSQTRSENGDICNGSADAITVGANTWTVQRTYSKTDDINSHGASFCLASAPNPIPRLSPGPSARPAALARVQSMPSYDRLLPLPPVTFDVQSNAATIDEPALHDYAMRLFYPLKPEHVMADFPGFLRQAADVLARPGGNGRRTTTKRG